MCVYILKRCKHFSIYIYGAIFRCYSLPLQWAIQCAGVSTVTGCATRPASAWLPDAPLHLRNVGRRREKGAVSGPHYKNNPVVLWKCASGDTVTADRRERRPHAPARG